MGGRCGACRRPLFENRPISLDGARFGRHLEQSDIPLLVDFWAPWFAPCRAMAPAFKRAARRLEPGVHLVKVDIDQEPALAEQFGMRSIPTIVLALRGREINRIAGARSETDLIAWVLRQQAAAAST
jgi:thioredoxin 2